MCQIIIIMGVSGCGKSTLGKRLAETIDATYIEGDDLHPESNIEKMSAGSPLEDKDRWPWFDRIIAAAERELSTGKTAVVGCSALKKSYRDYLCNAFPRQWRFIHLEGSFETIHERMKSRNHFMPPDLLRSQFDTLEPPEYEVSKCLILSIGDTVEDMVSQATKWI